ncbi:MAG TPA: hypothetical protein VH575_06625 [Gemmataceae bacterium]|jgi:hypothetical protein
MIDWSTLLVPIAVLAALMLFRFVGCGFEGQAGDVETNDPYDVAVVKDQPVFYYRLQETGTPGTATDHVQHRDGTYGISPFPLDEPAYLSPQVLVPSIELGAPSIMPKQPNATSVRFNGAVVAVFGPLPPLPKFTLEALVSPEWDVLNQRGFFYCVIENSMRTPGQPPSSQKNAGFALFAGPDDIANPTVSPYCWQLWIGTGNEFARANPVDGGPGPLVRAEPTYLAVTFGDTEVFLFAHTANGDLDSEKFELIRRPYVPATETLRIGIAGNAAALIPPFPGPAGFLYPFVGRMAEVAIYNKALADGRIVSHGMSAFDT